LDLRLPPDKESLLVAHLGDQLWGEQ